MEIGEGERVKVGLTITEGEKTLAVGVSVEAMGDVGGPGPPSPHATTEIRTSTMRALEYLGTISLPGEERRMTS